jgi:uridine kinase
MRVKFVGVAGGSGSGKSTLCETLREKYPDLVGLVQLDDYYKPADSVPKLQGMTNWECPESLFINRLVKDLSELKRGNPVVINTKNDRLNPEFKSTGKRIPVIFQPRPIVLVEGFLVLAISSIRGHFVKSIWLHTSLNVRLSRRLHQSQSNEYKKKVLVPMHEKYSEPSKKYASHILDTSALTTTQVLEEVEKLLSRVLKTKGQ